MLVLHNSPRSRLNLPGLDIEVLPLDTGTSKFEIQIELTPTEDGGLGGWLEYVTDLFDEATAVRLTEALVTLLDEGVARPDVPADELRMPSAADRETVVERWSGAAAEPAGTGLLRTSCSSAADRTPEAVALIDGARTLTYAELDEHANRLAHHLIARGVRSTTSSASSCRARPTPSSRCSRCSRPVRPTCRSTPPTRRAASRNWPRRRAPASSSPTSPRTRRPRHPPRPRRAAGRERVRPVHLRIDGPAQGRDQRARGRRQPDPVDAGRVRAPARRSGPAQDAAGLRRLRLGVAVAAGRRRAHRRRR